jgi:hypothetical protein
LASFSAKTADVDKKNKDAPALDLSFAYGETTLRRLRESGVSTDVDDPESTGDTTIRAMTSLFTGTRTIAGIDPSILDDEDSDDERSADG